MKSKSSFALFIVLLLVSIYSAQQVISLYKGAAPGSENWNWKEKDYFSHVFNTQLVSNVVHLTLTVFLPDSVPSNETVVIICPGGAFRILSINSEGKWGGKVAE